MSDPNKPRVRPFAVGAGAIAGAINILLVANQLASLCNYFQSHSSASTFTTTCHHHHPDEALDQEELHYVTDNWVVSPEHESAVLLDIRSAGLTKKEALAGLRKLYPRKEDTIGVRMLANGSKMLIVFATPDLQQRALLYGFQMKNHTTLYPTKALDGRFAHTLFVIDGIPIDDPLATRQKLETSLTALFQHIPSPRPHQQQQQASNDQYNPWPPTVHDVFFHQSADGYYQGKVTIILRGSTTFLQRSIQLEMFGKQYYNCQIHSFSMYCHHCGRVDRHRPQHCPQVPRETALN